MTPADEPGLPPFLALSVLVVLAMCVGLAVVTVGREAFPMSPHECPEVSP
jgi:hypothetical protein